jgi:alpha-glucosidase
LAEIFENPPQIDSNYEPLGAAELVDHDGGSLRLKAGSTIVEVSALAPDLFRVGAFPDGSTPRYDSEAIAKQDWEPVEVSMERSDKEITLSTSAATAQVSLDPLRVSFADASGRALAADDEDLGMGFSRRPEADVFT